MNPELPREFNHLTITLSYGGAVFVIYLNQGAYKLTKTSILSIFRFVFDNYRNNK